MSSTPPAVPPPDPVGDPPSSRRSGTSRDEDLVRENERLKAQLRTKDLETENATLKAQNAELAKKADEAEKARIAEIDKHQHDDPKNSSKVVFSFKK